MKVYSDFLLFSLWSVLFGYYCIIWASLYVGSSLSHYPKKRVSRSFLSRKRNTRKENEKVSVSYHRETILQKGNVIILTGSNSILNWKITWQSENIVGRDSSVFSIRFNAKHRLFIKHVNEIQFTMHQVIGSLYKTVNR